MSETIPASCLCGAVGWEIDGPLPPSVPGPGGLLAMSHCHCSRCRKAHGAPYATYLTVKASRFRITRGRGETVSYGSSPGMSRSFCRRCGSVVPDGAEWHGFVGVPAGNFDGDVGARPASHIFVASKASWVDIQDELPRFDAYPPGFDAPSVPERPLADPPGAPRGSCLCGQVAYRVEGPPLRSRTCHCSRCRKAGSAAHVSYLVTGFEGVRWLRGASQLVSFRPPDARYFRHQFCGVCGSSLPRSDQERGIDIIPMGTLDDAPPMRPASHIFVASKAFWDLILDDLPQHDEAPPA